MTYQDKLKPLATSTPQSYSAKLKPLGAAPQQMGVGQSIAQTLTKPFLRLGASVANLGEATAAVAKDPFNPQTPKNVQTIASKPRDFGWLGSVKPIGQEGTFSQKVKDAVGVGAEIGSFAAPATKGPALARATFGGAVKQSMKTGAKLGAFSGAQYGVGSELQNPDATHGSIVKEGLVNSAFGALGGGVLSGLGGATGGTIRGGRAVLTKSGRAQAEAQAVNDLEKSYQDIARGWVSTRKASDKAAARTQQKNAAGTVGRTPERVLAEQGIVPQISGTKFSTVPQANNLREKITPLYQANRDALLEVERFTPPIPLHQIEEAAVTAARSSKNIAAGSADDLENSIRQAFAVYRKNYGDRVPLTTLDDIKTARWGDTKFDSTRPLKGDENYIIGKAAKDAVEQAAEKAGARDVAQLNREIGDLIEASKFLEGLDGKAVLYGRMGTHMTRLGGAIIGSGGGPLGSIAGFVGGDLIATMLRSTSVSSPVKRLILKNLQKQNPEAYKQTLKWLQQQGLDRELRLSLPPPSGASTINQGRPIPVFEKGGAQKDYIGTDTTVMPRSTPQSQGNLPSKTNEPTAQTTNANPIISMAPSIPQNRANQSPLGSKNHGSYYRTKEEADFWVKKHGEDAARQEAEIARLKSEGVKGRRIRNLQSDLRFSKGASEDAKIESAKFSRGGENAFGVAAGFETDDEGNIKFNPANAALGLAGMTAAQKTRALTQHKDAMYKRMIQTADKTARTRLQKEVQRIEKMIRNIK